MISQILSFSCRLRFANVLDNVIQYQRLTRSSGFFQTLTVYFVNYVEKLRRADYQKL